MKEKAGPACGVLSFLAAAAAVAYSVRSLYHYHYGTDWVSQTIQFLNGLVGCTGAAVIFFFLVAAYGVISNKADERRARRIVRQGREYTVRCTPILMQKWICGDLPAKMDEEPGQETKPVLYCNVQMTSHGLCVSGLPDAATGEGADVDARVPIDLFRRDPSEPIFVDLREVNLYYVVYRREGNVELETAPSDALGYRDATPSIPDGSQLKVVLLLQTITEKSKPHGRERLEQPWQLKMVVLDPEGRDDARATADLYAMLYKQVAMAQEEIDYSWMYH